MTLKPGSTLGPYQIGGPLGAGGMGEVYRARDVRLKRDVAIKVLPESVAADAERLARFEREAHLLASLNHPNIAAIYGIEESQGTRCLVLELVEGSTLAERIAAGPVPLDDALGLALQMTEGLEAAHEKGVIHRDLKPANVKVTPEGKVKILDFGLAKAFDTDASQPPDGTLSPTLTLAATRAGVIIGTAAYMSPEQAKGRPADRRADIWAFGVVLFEMLSGRQLFKGESISEILAGVLMSEVDWSSLPAGTPPRLKRLLERCLDRDPKRRLRDIGEARIAIEEAISRPSDDETKPEGRAGRTVSPGRTLLPWAVAGALAVALVAMVVLSSRGAAILPAEPVNVSVILPESSPLGDGMLRLAVTPDDSALILVGQTPEGSKLLRRRLDRTDVEPMSGTDGGNNPFMSPDGRWVGFTADNHMKKVSLEGGPAVTLCDANWGGGTWAADGSIVFTRGYSTGLYRVPEGGGEAVVISEPDREAGELGHWWPQFLPGDGRILFTAMRTPLTKARIEALMPETGERRLLIESAFFGRYVPSGHLVFMRGRTMFVVAFDPEALAVTGSPVPVLEDLPIGPQDAVAQFAFSGRGTLAYIPAHVLDVRNDLVRVDRDGKAEPIGGPPDHYDGPRLSPDGRRLAVTIGDENIDIWILDPATGIRSRLTFGAASDFNPLWTPDGASIIYNVEDPVFDIYRIRADGGGQPEPLLTGGNDKIVSSLSPDGSLLAYTDSSPETRADIWVLPLRGEPTPRRFLGTRYGEEHAAFSPDGRWLAYVSDESDRREVYVQAFPDGGSKTRLSTQGGTEPIWTRDGRELLYRNEDSIMSVSIDTSAGFTAGRPRAIFTGRIASSTAGPSYDIAPDGRTIVIPRIPEGATPRQVNLIFNWFETLRRLAPPAGG